MKILRKHGRGCGAAGSHHERCECFARAWTPVSRRPFPPETKVELRTRVDARGPAHFSPRPVTTGVSTCCCEPRARARTNARAKLGPGHGVGWRAAPGEGRLDRPRRVTVAAIRTVRPFVADGRRDPRYVEQPLLRLRHHRPGSGSSQSASPAAGGLFAALHLVRARGEVPAPAAGGLFAALHLRVHFSKVPAPAAGDRRGCTGFPLTSPCGGLASH